jgi:hypothetical protein
MKSILVLFTILASSITFAAPGTLTGHCEIKDSSGSTIKSFEAEANQKWAIGFIGEDGGNCRISVVNNLGTPDNEQIWGWALAIGIARDKNESSFRNPPTLCPATPADARKACELENQKNEIQPTPNLAFIEEANDGHVEYEVVDHQSRISLAGLKSSQLVDGAVITTRTENFGHAQVTCTAVYHAP